MEIWINKIVGQKPNDLENINVLNHYIGMKKIEPESITELKIMPFIMIFMSLFGLVSGITGKNFLAYLWIALFVLLAAVGLFDFYLWEYDYGHNLDPNAALKVPGQTYQPPLIGAKKLLNFKAVSLPDVGSYTLIAAVGLTIFALVLDRKSNPAIPAVQAKNNEKNNS